MEVIKWIYVPEDKDLLEKERQGISDDTLINVAKQAHQLLQSWKQIPGMNDDGSIDGAKLDDWIKKVRALAASATRTNMTDSEIGKILAQYPETSSKWPQEKIFQVIEEINSDRLKSSYSSAMYNKRSFTSRSAFEGGNIERRRATYFEKLATDYRNIYPNVAEIFKNMQQNYLAEAKRMDDAAERDKLEY
jgi:hypothetical protein